jgi:Ca2+-binding RTX toxin-like protein
MTLFTGWPGPDTLIGTAGRDLIIDLGGDDAMSGREANDTIIAGPGADTVAGDNQPLPGAAEPGFGPVPSAFGGDPGENLILAGAGDDRVVAGFGSDTVFGQAGADTILGYGSFGGSPTGNTGVIAADGGTGSRAARRRPRLPRRGR